MAERKLFLLFSHNKSESVLIRFLIVLFLIALIFYGLRDLPYFAVLIPDLLLIAYFISLFQSKYKYLLLLHPVLLFIISKLFETPFLNCGDGDAYRVVVAQYLNTSTLEFHAGNLLNNLGFINFFKYASLGVAPIYAIPEYFFSNPSDEIYYLWQGTFHVLLCSIFVTLMNVWKVVNKKHLLTITLFAVVSPSFYDLGAAPTRHVVTFYGIMLLLVSHLAVLQKMTLARVTWYTISVMIVLISKAPLIVPYLIFAIVDVFHFKRIKINIKTIVLLFFIAVLLVFMFEYLNVTIIQYAEISQTGAATFSGFVQWPIIGWGVKYVYALLAPFPWSDATFIIKTIYGGNWLLFIMHTLSSLIGLYLFFGLILKWRTVTAACASDSELKRFVAYGLLMSLSILRGSTGFHTYLLIYFPFLTPLLTVRRFRVNIGIPIIFVTLLEVVVFIGK